MKDSIFQMITEDITYLHKTVLFLKLYTLISEGYITCDLNIFPHIACVTNCSCNIYFKAFEHFVSGIFCNLIS